MNYPKLSFKRIASLLQLFLLAFVSISIVRAAGAVDPTFNPALVIVQHEVSIYNQVNRITIQPDGKILVAGYFQTAGKFARSGIVRLNPDGSVDATFVPPLIYSARGSTLTYGSTIYAVTVQPDGKILIGGSFDSVGGIIKRKIARLNADGSLDTTFDVPMPYNPNTSVNDIKIADDGKITFVGYFDVNSPTTQEDVGRVLADGTPDSSFASPATLNNSSTFIYRVELLAGGKILISGGTGATTNYAGFVHRLNADGSLDATFMPVTTGQNSQTGNAPTVFALRLQADGKFYAGGDFTTVDGFPLNRLARFNADGTIDTSFSVTGAGAEHIIKDIEITPSGKVLVTGEFETYNGVSRRNVALLDASGNLDNSLIYSGNPQRATDAAILPDGKILVGQTLMSNNQAHELISLNADGSVNPTFNVLFANTAQCYKVLVQPDGKVLVAGFFTDVDNQIRYSVARVNTDGTLDPTFNLSSGEGVAYYGLDIRADGKILLSSGGGATLLNSDGSYNTGYTGGATYDARFLSDGGIVYAPFNGPSYFRKVGGVSPFNITTDAPTRKILIQPDGKFVVVGEFTQVAGVARGRIARINADGTLDTTFNPAGGAGGTVYDVALQADGKIIVGGGFSGINFNNNYKFLARLNADGSLDTSFNPILQGGAQSLKIQPDGKILVGGSMYTINGQPVGRIARLNADGSLDTSFNAGAGADDAVLSIDLQTDGNVVIGGLFTHVNNIDRLGVARLLSPTTTTRTPYDFDGDGRSDLSVFRPSTGTWYVSQSSTNAVAAQPFGVSGDLITPADFDGDGKTDLAVFRPSTGAWYLLRSTAGFAQIQFGTNGDLPVPADYDGDGKAELAVFRPSTGVWYQFNLTTNQTGTTAFGSSGDVPTPGDYDRDGKVDIAVFRSSNSTWYLNRSTTGFTAIQFGQAGDLVVPADYDADGFTDIAVFRPSNGTWYLNRTTSGFTAIQFGQAGDKPAPADYDGDGRIDLAVFRPSNGVWYLNRSTSGFTGIQFGIAEDTPAPNAFVR